MTSIFKKPETEKVSSFIVIAVLIVTFLLVLSFQSHFDPGRLGMEPILAEEGAVPIFPLIRKIAPKICRLRI